jgi:hypothetical protein
VSIDSSEMRDLGRAVEAGAVVLALERLGFTQRTLAWVTGASERSVRNWRMTSAIRPRFAERIWDVREIALLLDGSLSPRGVVQWFTARNRVLDGQRPVDVLRSGGIDPVRKAAGSFVDGGYV